MVLENYCTAGFHRLTAWYIKKEKKQKTKKPEPKKQTNKKASNQNQTKAKQNPKHC